MKIQSLLLVLFLVLTPTALAQTTITIASCSYTSTEGEKIRLAFIDTPELKGNSADRILANATRNYFNDLVTWEKVFSRRITKDRYGRRVAKLSKDGINIKVLLLDKRFASIYENYLDQCHGNEWQMQKNQKAFLNKRTHVSPDLAVGED